MALIQNLSLANTFGQWVNKTNDIVDTINVLYASDFTKPTGTLYLTEPTTGLSVSNNSLFGGLTEIAASGSLVVHGLAEVQQQLALTNLNPNIDNLVLSANGNATFTGNVTALNGSFTNITTTGNFTVSGSTIYNTDTFTLNAASLTNQNGYLSSNRPTGSANATIRWNESKLSWSIRDVNNSDSANAYANVITSNVVSSTTQAGIVQLTDSISSTSTTTAATPASVRTTYNSTFQQANNAFNVANAAFGQANNSFNVANVIFGYANSAYQYANTIGASGAASAFSQANNAFDRANSSYDYANTGYAQANSAALFANGAFTKANSAYDYSYSSIFSVTANTSGGLIANGTQGSAQTGNVLISIQATDVVAGTYGGTTHIPVYTVGSDGRITYSSNVTVASGATLSDDTVTDATRYPVYADTTTGTYITAYTSSTNYTYNPSTGTLSAVIFTSLSDRSVKDNIEVVPNALDTIKQLEGVSFNWKQNGNKSYGVIAQDIEQVLPDVVQTNDNGLKTVDYQALSAFLIESIKQLSSEIEELKKQK